jgi:hypothetical protein
VDLSRSDIVVVKSEGVLGVVLDWGVYDSTVVYCIGGILYEEILENTEFESLEDEV